MLGVGGVQLGEDVGGLEILALRAQAERLRQPTVDHGDGHRTGRILEVGQRGCVHAEAGQRGAERHAYRMRELVVERGVVDDRGQQPDDVGPAFGAEAHDDAHPSGLQPAGSPRDQRLDELVGGRVVARVAQRGRVGQVKVVGRRGGEAEVEPGVVGERQIALGDVELALQRTRGCRGPPDGLEDTRAGVAGGGQTRPRVALLAGDAS